MAGAGITESVVTWQVRGTHALSHGLPLAIAILSLAVFLNATFLSTYSANHVDLSINLAAADAVADGDNPYGISTLKERAIAMGSPPQFIYSSLFTSYIQPPPSAISLVPFTLLPWREATRFYLLLNHVFLFGAIALTLLTLKPSISPLWLLAITALTIAFFGQVAASFALGQVDASILLLLALGLWGYSRGNAPVAGVSIAAAGAIKLIPAILLLYFLWKREYKAFAWGVGTECILFLASVAVVGVETYQSYLTETLPALLSGSTHYSNISLGAVIARIFSDGYPGGVPQIISLGEVPGSSGAGLVRFFLGLAAAGILALVVPRTRIRDGCDAASVIAEFYMVVCIALLVSSVTWEFYVVWLLPIFLTAFLAPDRLFGSGTQRWPMLALVVMAFLMLNFPGDCGSSRDCYLFGANSLAYRPDLVPAVLVERQVHLYANHLDDVILVRLPGLFLVAGVLALSVVLSRRSTQPSAAIALSATRVQGK